MNINSKSDLKQLVISLALVIVWLILLLKTRSVFFIYLLVGLISLIGSTHEQFNSVDKYSLIFSIAFSLMISFANYELPQFVFLLISSFGVGYLFYSGLSGIITWVRLKISDRRFKISNYKLYLISLAIIMSIFVTYFVLVSFPGNLTPDSFTQINQIESGIYNNHHPIWHTWLIKIFMDLVGLFYQDNNIKIACYNLFQIFVCSSVISFTVLTIYSMTRSRKLYLIALVIFVIAPYNIAYSSTIWKDVPFSMSILLETVCLIRLLRNLGNKKLNLVLLFISCIGVGLLRNNGLISLILTAFFCLFLHFYKFRRTLLTPIFGAILVTLFFKGPVLSNLNVESSSVCESLSIPIQQVARVIYDNRVISKDIQDTLSKVIDLDFVKLNYDPTLSDPIKFEIEKRDQFIENNLDHLFEIWIHLGIQYPDEYLKAWIDQTCGYWNSGYDYWYLADGISSGNQVNPGLKRTGLSPFTQKLFSLYAYSLFMNNPMNLFISIGFWVWITMYILFYCLSKKDKIWVALTPVITVWLTLLIAAPVFAEFRYIYSLFLCIPVFISIPFSYQK